MSSKNGVPFRQKLVGAWNYGAKCPYAMDADSATIHETDNDASANNEVSYMIGNTDQVSYHVAIDENEAVQGIPFNRNTWNAGDGGSGHGNRKSISFEICRNYNQSQGTNITGTQLEQYKKAKANAIKVIAQIMLEQGIPANTSTVKSHYDRSGKNCPSKMRNDGQWIAFRDAVIKEYNRLKCGGSSSDLKPNSKPLKDGKVGDVVKVYNALYRDSLGAGKSTAKRGKQGKIKRIVGNSKKYLIEDWGWAHPNDIQLVKRASAGKPSKGKTKTVTIDVLNVYTGQKLSDKIVRTVKKGQKVKVTTTANNGQSVHGSKNWSEIDSYGWVPSVYLK
ncbi:N-acetylmuramoyl-L-alanine amidase [Enterococcus diestrammenae]|uniref:N-acetylmuramoyl-L-alanine amidase n=1 Tax=Enterococcus diestrammenae TaxID=1155073 RepID=A0ABV0F2F9_9ENTE